MKNLIWFLHGLMEALAFVAILVIVYVVLVSLA